MRVASFPSSRIALTALRRSTAGVAACAAHAQANAATATAPTDQTLFTPSGSRSLEPAAGALFLLCGVLRRAALLQRLLRCLLGDFLRFLLTFHATQHNRASGGR